MENFLFYVRKADARFFGIFCLEESIFLTESLLIDSANSLKGVSFSFLA